MEPFLLFLFVGFVAQAVDGALGMAYGVISSTVLLSFGVSPALASAAVHSAEVFTTAASAGSHAINRNVNWKLFAPLALGGCIGGGLGAFLLTGLPSDVIKPFITVYLALMGVAIIWRAARGTGARPFRRRYSGPLGFLGGFLDAVGGGGWGPTVTATMIGAGAEPRVSVGTANAAEFFVTSTISATFLAALLSGHWTEANGFAAQAGAVAGLVLGGLMAAPLAGFIVRLAPVKVLTYAVGVVVLLLASYQTVRQLGLI